MSISINFYNINDALYYVDLPGYGYANASVEVKAKWGKMIEKMATAIPPALDGGLRLHKA